MESTVSAFKTLIVPALVSLILFVLITFVAIPAWRRYRSRYYQYLPLDSISTHTSSIRHRITSRLGRMLLPSTWRMDRHFSLSGRDDGSDHDGDTDVDDGEELGDVDQEAWFAVENRGNIGRPDNARRLSRDLEEGFRDDSDDEGDSAGSR